MYQIILVPLDMSARAERILPHVEDLAHRYDAKVIFLYVLEHNNGIVGPNGSEVNLSEEVVRNERRRLKTILPHGRENFVRRELRHERGLNMVPSWRPLSMWPSEKKPI